MKMSGKSYDTKYSRAQFILCMSMSSVSQYTFMYFNMVSLPFYTFSWPFCWSGYEQAKGGATQYHESHAER